MTECLFCLFSVSFWSTVDKWCINLLLSLCAKNSTKNRFKQSPGIYERLKERTAHCTDSQMPAEVLRPVCQSSLYIKRSLTPIIQSDLESEETRKGKGQIQSPMEQAASTQRILILVTPTLPGRRVLIDYSSPAPTLWLGPTPQAAAVLPQLLEFFITIFSAFHFPSPGKAEGPHLFLSSPFPVPRSRAHTRTRAGTLHIRPPKLL